MKTKDCLKIMGVLLIVVGLLALTESSFAEGTTPASGFAYALNVISKLY